MQKNWWHHEQFSKKIFYLQERARIVSAVRRFFDARGYLEVETPALQASPCMEPHIQAFRTGDYYLHTSPEFAMKKLLVAGLPKIYQLAKVFRDEMPSRQHSPEFCLLEWYQTGLSYKDMMQETTELIRAVTKDKITFNGKTCDPHQPWEIITVVDAVKKYAGVDIAEHLGNLAHIKAAAEKIGVYTSPSDDWENALLKIMMEKVEPHLGAKVPTILCDYPVSMAALSRPKPEDSRFAERFEVYICSVELCNAFGELTDARVQHERFLHDVALRRKIYNEDYPVDEDFIAALRQGLKPCSGNALGVDRLVMLLTGAEKIELVQAAPVVPPAQKGWTPLHYAASAEAQGIDVARLVEELLEIGVDPHKEDFNGDTAYNIAAPSSPVTGRLMTNYWLSGRTLKDLNDRSGSHGSTLAQYIAKWSRDEEIEEHLKTKRLNIEMPNAAGWTPLSAAAAMGRVKAVEAFVKLYSPEALKLKTTEAYTTSYNGYSVTYGINLDASGLAKARLKQDKGLSDELRANLQRCVEILGG